MQKFSTGVVYFTNREKNGDIEQADGLCGLRITNLCGIGDRGYALSDMDTFDLETAEKIGIINPKMVSSGLEHFVALTTRGDLYSWGCGEYGELGQGPKSSQLEVPTLIKHPTKFSSISCGYNHTCALDSKGNMFSWGQNFDRQLGLYKKTRGDLPEHCVVEELMMTPKFVPISLHHPIKSVSCGSRFTVVVTMVPEHLSSSPHPLIPPLFRLAKCGVGALVKAAS
jgi:alpha-tubulin suppressor-like RCC1 family protein